MLGDDDILKLYLDAGAEAQNNGQRTGVAALAFAGMTTVSVNTVAAPWSVSAVLGLVSTGGWPTVVTATHPVGLVVGALGLAYLALERYSNSQNRDRVRRHLNCRYPHISTIPRSFLTIRYSGHSHLPLLEYHQRRKRSPHVSPASRFAPWREGGAEVSKERSPRRPL